MSTLSSLFAGKKKLLWILAGVVVIGAVAGTYLIYSANSPSRGLDKSDENTQESGSGGIGSSGSAENSDATGSSGGSADQLYTNDQADISFNYPSDWEIKQEYFYETAAGEKATVPTIILGRKADPADATSNQISINLRQATCEGGSSPTYESDGVVQVAIYTQSGSSQKCMESTADGKDVNGKTSAYEFLSFFDDESVKAVFKNILVSFRAGD